MFFVEGFLAAFAIIDADGALQALNFQVAEGLATEVVERSVYCDIIAAYRTALFALKVEGGWWGVGAVEIPVSGRDIDARAVSNAILVNPQFVLVGDQPSGVSTDGFTLDVEGRGRGLVPHLQVQLVVALRHDKGLWHAKLQFAVECQIELTFSGNADGLVTFQGEGFRKFYRDVVGVLLPEGGEHGSPLRTTVIEDVAQPYLEIARIPYPCCRCCLHVFSLFCK